MKRDITLQQTNSIMIAFQMVLQDWSGLHHQIQVTLVAWMVVLRYIIMESGGLFVMSLLAQ